LNDGERPPVPARRKKIGGGTVKAFKRWTICPMSQLKRRMKLLLVLCTLLAGMSKLLYLKGLLLPNMELIIPTLVVAGCLMPNPSLSRTLPLLGIVFLEDVLLWGPRPIYLFTWSGFLFCWLLARRNRTPVFGRFKTLLPRVTLSAILAILLFDFWTGIVGWSLLCGSLFAAAVGQLPFTLYHLSSLLLVPPLVVLFKLALRVPVPVLATVKVPVGMRNEG